MKKFKTIQNSFKKFENAAKNKDSTESTNQDNELAKYVSYNEVIQF